MEDIVHSLCWNITGKCNENCKFCYRKRCVDKTLEENKKIFDNIMQISIEKISFCGGEPFLYEDLFLLVRYIRERNPKIKLSITTNGKCLDDTLLAETMQYFDWISFSIDGSNDDINEYLGRGYEHLSKVIELLEKCNNKINIKVNTVVNKINKDDLENIYHIIYQYNIKRWKLFRFYPIRGARDFKDMFYLDKKEAMEVESLLKKLDDESSFHIEYNDFEDEPSCFSIQPDGTLEDSNNIIIGNFLDDSIDKLLEAKRLDVKNYNHGKRLSMNLK